MLALWQLNHAMTATVNAVTTSIAQIAVSYNTHYNVSVEATFCGQRNISVVIEIYYGEYIYYNSIAITVTIHYSHGQEYGLQL